MLTKEQWTWIEAMHGKVNGAIDKALAALDAGDILWFRRYQVEARMRLRLIEVRVNKWMEDGGDDAYCG